MWLLLSIFTLASLGIYTGGSLPTSHLMSYISKRKGDTVFLECQFKSILKRDLYTHWYRQKPGQPPKRMLYINSRGNVVYEEGFSEERYEAKQWQNDLSSNLRIYQVTEEDTGTYYCACWGYSSGWTKVFAEGTKLIVIPPDKSFDADISPKPTIFLPSVAETNLHKAGTYLCLLEKFFPDVIRVYWKEKDGDKILESQEGNTLKTNDTYMKFSWLTVTKESMRKEHICIVKHENNKRGVDQEISFPPIEKVAVSAEPTPCWHENAVLQLQLTSTSAYYTYLLLLLKSAIHLAVVSFSLARRTATCGNEKRA